MDNKKLANFFNAKVLIGLRNTPAASHMGGAWEQQIQSARSILLSRLKTHSQSWNDESFCTLMEKVGIMNSRPLTVETLSDVSSYKPLSPSDLLTIKLKVVLPPAGKFQKENLYTRKYWRRVRHLANEFWCRWWKEVLLSLQECQKGHLQKRNFMVGNIVLLQVSYYQNNWPMAKTIHVCPDKNGAVLNV